jgi:putative serine protease PepD
MRFPRLIILLVSAVMLSALAAACGGGDDDNSSTPTGSGGPTGTSEATTKPVGNDDLAHVVVQIFAIDASDNKIWSGSGTLISEDGLILTNGHVVDDRQNEYDHLGVGLTESEDTAPDIKYKAEIQAVDYAIDLAVIKITKQLDGGAVLENFPYVKIGDSNDVHLGDAIKVFGYPGIGGETITLTQGSISGFTSERSVGDRAWIKTDATISGGNSGGLAVNDAGELIGVPTIVGSGADTHTVDCRVLEDTNGDGVLDSNDTCVSVGGFINGIRPVNLAKDLITAAENGTEYVSPYGEETGPTPTGGFDTTSVAVRNFQFSPDVTSDDLPTEVSPSLPSGSTGICAFWDYEAMQDGESWDAIWYVDGVKNDQGSIINDTWSGGESGNWWACYTDPNGLVDGVYEIVIQVEGEVQGGSAIYLGDDHPPVSLTFDNQSGVEVCAVAVAPPEAQNWGGDKLGSGITLQPGETHTIQVGAGAYDVLAVDCNGDTVEETYDNQVTTDSTYTITG